jgi:hypothetical protein
MNPQHANFISNYAAAVNVLLAARASLKVLREQYTALGLSVNLTSADFTGSNATLSTAEITAAIATMDTLESVLTDFSVTPPTPTAALQALVAFIP